MNHNLKKIEPTPCASSDAIEQILLSALETVRKEKTLAIAVALEGLDSTWTTYHKAEGGTWVGLMGIVEIVKDKIMNGWRNAQ